MSIKDLIIKEAKNSIEKYGFRKFTMDGLAQQLKISKKTIYENFSSKDELISCVINSIIQEDAVELKEHIDEQKDYVDKLRAIFFLYNIKILKKTYVNELKIYYPQEWEKLKLFSNHRKAYVRQIYQQGIDNDVFISKFNNIPKTFVPGKLNHTVDLLIFFLTSIIDQAVETELIDYEFDVNTMLVYSYDIIVQMFLVNKVDS